MKPSTLDKLKARHEKAIEAFATEQMHVFRCHAKTLLERIQREIPALTGIVSCNGDSWLTPEDVPVMCKDGEQTEMRHVLESVYMASDDYADTELPDVSDECLEAIEKLRQLSSYCADERTLEQIAVEIEPAKRPRKISAKKS